MTYYWIAEPPADDAGLAADMALGFGELPEAEDWLATFYDDLAAAGVERMTLLDGAEPVLGPMDLTPAGSPGSAGAGGAAG
jgi:hypothetical protein